ncbi:glycosyltransferase family 4 protein [archaeon]|jgi:L-malate glycosyltransferase|nr:glycosyltransferase family 4 protein [archaeon]MBT4272209.1 glycosyltransferase family 4 protein [archaeon]MBT4460638.1 glycosyltransferase family 4 protein [archaeon]MBT4858005.1 glycosyltransferase family 4 protein [archaeon]MBT5424113.1 glycosyltransferase family 4 protein [archaeon]
MKILMLNYEFPPIGGGSANATNQVLNELAKYDDVEIDLVTSSKGKYQVEKFSKNITIYKLNINKKNPHFFSTKEIFLWSFRTLFFLPKLFKKKNYDVCHCWSGWPPGFFGFFFENNQNFLIGLRGTDVPGFNPRMGILDKIIFKPYSKIVWGRAVKVIANSQGLKELAQKTWKGDIEIIYNGIDTTEFKPGKKVIKKNKIITVCRLIERKGLKYLISSLKNLDVELDIIGEGPELSNLKKLAKDLNVKVNFLGYVNHKDLPKHYQNATLFVLPSFYEGMSNSILEAMACGLPIITTGTGGSKELIKRNGIIIKQKSEKSIRKAITTIINNNLSKKMSKESREIALRLSWSNVAKQYIEIYKQI